MKNKFKLLLIILSLVLFTGVTVGQKKAEAYENEGTLIDIDVEGSTDDEFKVGDSVTIKVKLNDVKDLFAASFLYTYDNTSLQIDSVDINSEIQSEGVYEPYKDTAKDGNKARYCFTLLGDRDGLSGTYDFAVITGKAKKDGKINVGTDNFSFQLIQKKDNDMVKAAYYFKDSNGDIYSVTNIEEDEEKSNENASSPSSPKASENKKSDSAIKVELVEKAGDSNDDASSPSSPDKDGLVDVDGENSESSEETSGSSLSKDDKIESSNKDDSVEKNQRSNNNFVILGVSAVVIIGIILGIFIYKKKK